MNKYMGCAGQIDETRLQEFEDSGLYIAEPKRDGCFATCVCRNGEIRFFSRTGKEKKVRGFPAFPRDCVVVGELAYGQQDALERIEKVGHPFMDVFDILEWDGTDVTALDDNERRGFLESVQHLWGQEVRSYFPINPRWTSDFVRHFEEESEGIVLKQVKGRPSHPYIPGSKNPYWIKCKKELEVDLVVMRYVLSDADSYKDQNMAKSLVCGVYEGEVLKQVTSVPGLTTRERRDIVENWNEWKGAVVRVKCNKVFKSGALRHPRLLGRRDGKEPQDCTWADLMKLCDVTPRSAQTEEKKPVVKRKQAEKKTPRREVELEKASQATTDPEKIANQLEILANLTALTKPDLDPEEQKTLRFKVQAYQKAAYTIRNTGHGFDFANTDPGELPGVGEKIACKIREIVRTGTCQKIEDLRGAYGKYLPLLDIPGVGPAKARDLYDNYSCKTIQDVQELSQRVSLGKRIEDGLKQVSGHKEGSRIPRSRAEQLVKRVLETFKAQAVISRAEAAGSFRRQRETVGDLDIIVETENPREAARLCQEVLDEVSLAGDKKVSGLLDGVQVDIRLVDPSSYGACLLYFTGSKQFNISQRQVAQKYGWTLNEYGLFNGRRKLAGETEEEIFEALGMEYIPPEKRDQAVA